MKFRPDKKNPAWGVILSGGSHRTEDRLPACLGRRASSLPKDAREVGAKKDQAGSPIAETGWKPILRFPIHTQLVIRPLAFLLAIFAFAVASAGLRAADPRVEATLSDDRVSLGDQVELQVKITGASSVKPPDQVSIDGLTIGGVSQSTQRSFNILNGSYSSTETSTFTFPIIPNKSGVFTIPAITINVDGKKMSTRPLKLTVTGNGGNSATTQGGGGNADEQEAESNSEIARAELVIPKQGAYLGETIPVEIRLYFNAQVQVQIPQGASPQINLDGFTMQKLTQPQQKRIEKDGKSYNCLVFKTAITPAKTGKLQVGPLEMPYIAMIQSGRKQRRPRLGGAFDAMFNDPLFNNMMNMPEPRQLMVRSAPADLEIKPLPAEGKPAGFTGAVGQFRMETRASPLKLQIGDPLTVKMEITGHGNFDRLNAPRMPDESGWQSYPPTSKFTPEDDAGINGTKTFEMALIPQEKKTALPALEFSYFDPVTEKYVTLNSQPLPITVEGQPAQIAASRSTPAPAASASPGRTQQPKQKSDDIFYIADTGRWWKSFEPVYVRRDFWLLQIVPALGLAAFAGLQIRSARRNNAQAVRLAKLQKEKADLLKTLNHAGTGYTEFFEAAARYLQVETARTTGRDPASISPGDAIASRELKPEVAADVEWIFSSRAELRYTGGSGGIGDVPDGKRTRTLEAIRRYENV